LLKDVEESSKFEINDSLQSSGVGEKSPDHSERPKIVISVQDKDGTKQIRMFTVYNSFGRYTLCCQCMTIVIL